MSKIKRFHLIGVGGIGMSGVARLLAAGGHEVTGSDVKRTGLMDRLASEGIKCFAGHAPDNIGRADTVIYSTSIRPQNPELVEARRRGLEIVHRAGMLARMAEGKRLIAVTGAHGKTTTTALLACILRSSGLDPTVAVGGIMSEFDTNALSGRGDIFLVEADESDGSFLRFRPERLLITNIDREHLDYYNDIDAIKRVHRDFIARISSGGALYYSADDAHMMGMTHGFSGRSLTFGASREADIRASDVVLEGMGSRFTCIYRGRRMGEVVMPVPGRHQILNALAATLVSLDIGVRFDDIALAVSSYKGTGRRFEVRECGDGVTVISDYAHHPAEIKAVLEACGRWNRPVITVFQPHRYTRTKALFDDFVDALKVPGKLILADIYSASEEPIEGVSSSALRDMILAGGRKDVEVMPREGIAGSIAGTVKRGDVILVLGAGDISGVADELARLLADGTRADEGGDAFRDKAETVPGHGR